MSIDFSKIKSHTLRMCRNNSTPRLRKCMWTDDNVFKSMKELNNFFKGKRIAHKGAVFFNFEITQHKAGSGEHPYFFQLITFDRKVSWEKGYKEIMESTTEMWPE